ncbi:MAG: glycosyltransferase, partial [Firmicutes bacterium]|nr:glycosyltransferase [Bacillota bacterium]
PGYEYRIILVNDGSPDDTFQAIQSLCEQDKRIIGVDLSRNYGQAHAKMAALSFAAGDALVFMDDDGQHPAAGIFCLLKEIEQGNDVVYARFAQKQHGLHKCFLSFMHNKLSEWNGVNPKGVRRSAFVAWSRFAFEAARQYKSPFPSPAGYLMHVTSKITSAEVEHRKRAAGRSGYTVRKLFKLWMDSFTNFSVVPLRFASFIGALCACGGFMWGVVLVVRKLVRPAVPMGYTSTVSAILFVGGVIMLMLGLLGEYIGRIYMTVSGMPQYKVSQIINEEESQIL